MSWVSPPLKPMSFVLSPAWALPSVWGCKVGLVLAGAFVVLLTVVGLVLMNRVTIDPFPGWDGHSDL